MDILIQSRADPTLTSAINYFTEYKPETVHIYYKPIPESMSLLCVAMVRVAVVVGY